MAPVVIVECGGEWEVDPTQTSADEDEDEQQVVVGVVVRLDPLAGGEDDDDGDQAGDAHDVQHNAQHRLDHIFADDWGKDLTILNISLTVFGDDVMVVILLVYQFIKFLMWHNSVERGHLTLFNKWISDWKDQGLFWCQYRLDKTSGIKG